MAGSVPYVKDSTFADEVLKSDKPVLVDFTATWCGPCKAIAPLLDQVSAAMPEKLKVVKLDIDNDPISAQKFNVMSIPTLLIFKGGKVVAKQVGSLNKSGLDKFVAGAVG